MPTNNRNVEKLLAIKTVNETAVILQSYDNTNDRLIKHTKRRRTILLLICKVTTVPVSFGFLLNVTLNISSSDRTQVSNPGFHGPIYILLKNVSSFYIAKAALNTFTKNCSHFSKVKVCVLVI